MADEIKPQDRSNHPTAERIRYIRDQISPSWNETKNLISIKDKESENYWKTRKDFANALYKKEQQGLTDSLTLLLNRQGIIKRLEAEKNRAIRKNPNTKFSIIFLDVNGLKEFNDTIGYAAGDKLLQRAAIALGSVSRPYDIVGRYGGDEFIEILPETDSKGVLKHWENTNNAFQANSVWISAGIATAKIGNIEEAMLLAETLMKGAKAIAKERYKKIGIKDNEIRTWEEPENKEAK